MAAFKGTPGPIYNIHDNLGDNVPKWGFGTAEQRPDYRTDVPVSSTDHLDIIPDSQPFKYDSKKPRPFGTAPRDQMNNAMIFKYHPQAFYGKMSPGPSAYRVEDADRAQRTRSNPGPFGLKTKILEEKFPSTPASVGPGLYKPMVAIGSQLVSTKKTLPNWTVGKAPRFGLPTPVNQQLDVYEPESALGKQAKSKKKTYPSFSFGTGTRAGRERTALGNSHKPAHRIQHPMLPVRNTVIKMGPPPSQYI